MTEEHEHEWWARYVQPKIEEGILIEGCLHCEETSEVDAQEWWEEHNDGRSVYLFDFNNKPDSECR
jgi:hypothetical protein